MPEPDGARALRVACVALAALLLAFSAGFSAQAPLGAWQNELFGAPTWYEFDPASYYVSAADSLRWGEPAIVEGHPGAPLVVVLRALRAAWCGVAAPPGLGCPEFLVRHLPALFLLAKLLLTLFHLASFAALYGFARSLLGDARAACLAVLGYATSLPVLFYLSRVSVEPIVMLCFFGAFACLWRYEDLARAGRTRAALAAAGAAALIAVTGAFAKFNLLAPLPALLAVAIGWQRGATRLRAALVFAAVAAFAAALWSPLVDWRRFLVHWGALAQPAPSETTGEAVLWCESAFLVLGLAGCRACLRRGGDPRARMRWVCAYAALTLLPFAYRIAIRGGFVPFHYLFVATGVLAVGFGDTASRLLRARGALAALALVALVHGVGAAAVLESRRHDVAEFAPQRPVFTQLARLGPHERVGVEPQLYASARFQHWLRALHGFRLARSRLRLEFEALFAPVAGMPQGARRLPVPALGAELLVPGPRAE